MHYAIFSPSLSRTSTLTPSHLKFAQEILSTFSTAIGEVALVPSTGGVFTVDIEHAAHEQGLGLVDGSPLCEVTIKTTGLWDRKRDGGFPGKWMERCKGCCD